MLIKADSNLIDQNTVIALWKSLVESIPLQTESIFFLLNLSYPK